MCLRLQEERTVSIHLCTHSQIRMDIALIGYIASLAIGLVLGLIGGGGSILTVPVLVYLFHVEPVSAAAYSYFVVGVTGSVGASQYTFRKLVHASSLWFFGLPSIVAVYITRRWIVPAIPEQVFGNLHGGVSKDSAMMVLFALLMIPAAWRMIRKQDPPKFGEDTPSILWLIGLGIVVGGLTALVGVGGGFLIVPALLVFARLPMKTAVGTSLVIIAANAWVGFAGSAPTTSIEWPMVLKITALAVAGLFVGSFLSKSVDGARLKPAFGWFVLAMGLFVLAMQWNGAL
jgi:uncharacterized protein